MKDFIKRYMRIGIVLIGVVMLALYGRQAIQLGLDRPVAPEITTDMGEAAAAEATHKFETERTRWNNQFARKGFFALIGLFLALLSALPKKRIWIPKVIFSSGLVGLIIHHLLADGKILSITEEGFNVSIVWILLAFVVKGTGMGCTVWRWKVLLNGQGFKIPLRHLIESFLIGRFIGSFAPGTSGLDGYRAYDISRYTGKVARSISVIFVEKLIGFFVLGTLLLVSVPVGQNLFAEHNVNPTAIVMMGLVFSGMMLASMVLLFKPALFRWILDLFIPKSSPVRRPFEKAIRAVTAYEKRKLYMVKATAIGFGVHVCTIGMYFCTSRAIGQLPGADDLFVTGAIMIGATVMPLSIAGIGMREGVFVFFLGPIAAIYAFGGYLVGELISLIGGPVWLARRGNYYEVIKAQRDAINQDVDDDDDDDLVATDDSAPTGPLPSIKEYALTGLGAGLVAGLGVALADAFKLWTMMVDFSLPGYAALIYGVFLGVLGGLTGACLAILGRLVQKPAAPPRNIATTIGFALFFVFVFAIGVKFIHRDIFDEKVGLLAGQMLGSLAALGAGLLIFCTGAGFALRKIFAGTRERFIKVRFAAMFYSIITAALVVVWVAAGDGRKERALGPTPENAKSLPNIVLVMNDTHRADYTGAYGGAPDLTPNLDALAKDGVVFSNAFAQSSWTRPSVSTILTGRYPSSHTAIFKTSVLPEELTTLAEVLWQGGYETFGLVTNYNLTPFFKFDQGFVDYRYLSPNLPLGSSDAQSKLFFIEVLKQVSARLRGNKEVPEDYYVIGEEVTAAALDRLDTRDTSRPFFMFLSYMDVHDPYFRHPFDGYGISHRANPNPDLSMAEEMKELYKGEVKYWDGTFGDLIGGLKKRGLYDDTLIVVTSDHGEEFGEHGGFWHGTTLYDEQLRILFIAKYPVSAGVTGGAKISDWIRLLDVAPFIAEQVGLERPKEWQGAPAPKGKRPVFAEEDHQGNVLTSIRYFEQGNEFKIIRANEGNPRKLEPLELYRTDTDPKETKNLASEQKKTVEQATELLDQIENLAAQGAAAAVSGNLSKEATNQLKALGYIEE
ncbi:MAG: sulfatase-like hydrolase/transferase [Deltaproteobacteria bacterium]|nr:sulfatase-like hydrolase/transferase [Deltaproteobacteria bacterium]